MSQRLVRFGVAMDGELLGAFDELVSARATTRSALLSDLARAEVSQSAVRGDGHAVGSLTLVYDHHVPDLSEKLTEMQHRLGHHVHSTMHVHLDQDRCLEVIVMRGPADLIRAAADRILAARGVLHGALELFSQTPEVMVPKKAKRGAGKPGVHSHVHGHGELDAHGQGHEHSHAHAHGHTHVPSPVVRSPAVKRAPAPRRARS